MRKQQDSPFTFSINEYFKLHGFFLSHDLGQLQNIFSIKIKLSLYFTLTEPSFFFFSFFFFSSPVKGMHELHVYIHKRNSTIQIQRLTNNFLEKYFKLKLWNTIHAEPCSVLTCHIVQHTNSCLKEKIAISSHLLHLLSHHLRKTRELMACNSSYINTKDNL